MKAALITYAIVEGISLLFVLYLLIKFEPLGKANGMRDRIRMNWHEGGKVLFATSFVISLAITFGILKALIFIKLIDLL